MKPIVMRKGERIVRGNEVQFDITCCMDAKARIEHWKRVYQGLKTVLDEVRPVYSGGFQLVSTVPSTFKLNFCPVCGTEYKEEKE